MLLSSVFFLEPKNVLIFEAVEPGFTEILVKSFIQVANIFDHFAHFIALYLFQEFLNDREFLDQFLRQIHDRCAFGFLSPPGSCGLMLNFF